ncbi:MAG: mechanosensitive ion channel [Ruminococcaceae bacterium]|nr:mechanosensitive ion channel [Oscillospiraceae bacterium]
MLEFLSSIMASLGELAMSIGMKLIYAVILLIVGFKLSSMLCKKLEKSKSFAKIDASVSKFLLSILRFGLNAIILISAALVLGVPSASFIAILGSAGLAVGMALQGSLSNLAGSIMLVVFKPFKVGDYIEAAGVAGVVEEINIFYTIINTVDNKRITLPNGTVSNGIIVDYSSNETRRVDLTFGAAYGTDVAQMKALMLQIAENHPLVLKDPAPVALFTTQNDSSLDFVLRVWCNSADYWTVNFEVLEQVHAAMLNAGIEIPFPQMDVHVKND